MGIIGTCLLVLALVGLTIVIIISVNGGFESTGGSYSDTFIGGLE